MPSDTPLRSTYSIESHPVPSCLLAGAVLAQDGAADYGALLATAIEQGRAGEMTDAVASFERAIAIAADDDQRARALLMLATAYRAVDDGPAALTTLERALELPRGYEDLVREYFRALGEGRP